MGACRQVDWVRPCDRDRGAAAAGFTLLEILVVLVVLGVLLAGLAQANHFGLLAVQRQTATIAQSADIDAVDRLLRQVIERIDPGDQHDRPYLTGTSSSLEFTSELPPSVAVANHHAQMRLLADPAHRLLLRWAPTLHAVLLGPPPTPTDTVLLTGVDHLDLAYWPQAPATGWRSAWAERTAPALVRIRIVFTRGDARHWPTIVVAPLRETP